MKRNFVNVFALGFMLTLVVGCPAGPPMEREPPPAAGDGDGDEPHVAEPKNDKYAARRACRVACNQSAVNCRAACRQQALECNKAGRPGDECAQLYKSCFAPCRIDRIRCRQACRQNN